MTSTAAALAVGFIRDQFSQLTVFITVFGIFQNILDNFVMGFSIICLSKIFVVCDAQIFGAPYFCDVRIHIVSAR